MTIRLHLSNQSNLLRTTAVDRCKYCGTPVAWFDRYDHLRIPLTSEFPAHRVPANFRWHVNRGIAYPGGDVGTGYCRLPHPALCPAIEHQSLPPQLKPLVQRLGVLIQRRIDRGEFTPAPATQKAAPAPESVESGDESKARHVLAHHGDLRIAPCRIEDVQCVATDLTTKRRCENRIFALEEGLWRRVEIPYAPGRAGQMILSASGGLMYVWSVNDFTRLRRWWKQRCHSHYESAAPDHVGTEWAQFNTLRHADHLTLEKPEGYELSPPVEEVTVFDGPSSRQKCAADGCVNATVTEVPDGWLCWQCTKLAAQRSRIHRKWQEPADRNAQGDIAATPTPHTQKRRSVRGSVSTNPD